MTQLDAGLFATNTLPQRRHYPAYKPSGVEWLGEIPTHWQVKRLKRVFKAINGSTPSSNVPEYWDGETPWVTPDDLGKLEGDALFTSNRKITTEGYQSCGTNLVPPGSLILSTRAPIGHLALAGVELCTNQGCRSLVFLKADDRRYYYYLLHVARSELESLGTGSTFRELGKADLESVFLTTPPLPEQQAIAAYLDRETTSIDTLIDRKQRLISLLQEKRTALISHAVTRGLDPSAPLKPSGVEWLGEIPAHWEIRPLRRVISKFVDYRGATPTKTTEGVRLITARNIKNGIIDLTLSEEFISESDYLSWMVRGFPEVGDVLITTEAPLGEAAQIFDTYVALAQRVILLKADKTQVCNDYLKYYLKSPAGTGELWSRATGSTAIGIKASHLREILVIIPSIDEQRAIGRLIDFETAPIVTLIVKIRQHIAKLLEYRTALISAAVTGKIDVREETSPHNS